MRKLLAFAVSVALLLLPLAGSQPVQAQQNPASNQSFVGGRFVAKNYNYPGIRIDSGGGAASTTYTINLSAGAIRLPDGRTIVPFSSGGSNSLGAPGPALLPNIPISVGAGLVQETVTPTTVSGCYVGAPRGSCQITAAFTYAHGAGEVVTSGSYGIQEAINDAGTFGGGVVEVDASENQVAGGVTGVTTAIAAANVIPTVYIEDTHSGITRNWTTTPTGLALALPTTLTGQAACDATHTFCSDATVAGSASWGGAVFGCVAYVDIAGNEGPCSATATFTTVASKAIDIASPAASAGAVGWVPYLSLSGGSYILAYQIPVTATVCTLTTLETVTPACAVTNSTYGQTGSTYGAGGLFTAGGAQITTYPVSTAMLYTTLATVAQTITGQHAITNSSLTYKYAPSSRMGSCPATTSLNMVQLSAAGGISGSSATTVPNPLGTWTIPANCFNYIGAEFRVSGKFTFTDGGDTSTHIIVAWDSNVTDTASVPTPLCDILDTATGAAAAQNGTYYCVVRVLTTGASGTAMVNGYGNIKLAAGATTLVRDSTDKAVAASAAIDLATNGRITVMFEGIGATNNPGAQTLEGTLEVMN